MTQRRAAEITAMAIVLACLAILAACGDQPPPRPPVEPPPAAKEVQTLREQELAAEKRAAEATAAGDQNAADYNRRLADELAKVRAKWQQIEADQRAQIAKDQTEIEARAQVIAEKQQLAADIRRARIVAGIGLALCAVAAALGAWSGLGRLALPIAGSAALGCLTLAGFAESMRSAWFLPVILGGLAIAVVAWVRIARGDRALVDTAKLADALETKAALAVQKAKTFGSELDDRGHAVAEKAAAWASQQSAGVLKRVAKARGKTPKTTKPNT
jgi:predicted small lipoprotein YifL